MILNCFNTAFSDYLIPLQLSLEQLETKLHTESIAKGISVGAFKENILIGFVLHGQRTIDGIPTAYNAGTGVIPKERGQGITQKMYEFIKPILKQRRFQEVYLETISTNTPAIISYEKIGFEAIRGLSCFKGKPNIPKVNKYIKIKEVKEVRFDALPQFGEIRPTWQNSKETILRMGTARYFLALKGDGICGYCILNHMNNRILQIAVKKEYRNGSIGTSLLNYLTNKISEPISIINVDDAFKPTLCFFEKRNMKKTLSQIEMKLKIGRA
ncbi:MAG: GNAT family N-acetyltransferase [Bacteroidota bacterium]